MGALGKNGLNFTDKTLGFIQLLTAPDMIASSHKIKYQ